MKKYVWFLCLLLFTAVGCSKTTLIDQSLNTFSATATTDLPDHIRVEWLTNSFYQNYQVLRSDSPDGIYSSISPLTATNGYDDTSVPTGKSFYYRVRGYNTLNVPLYTTESTEGIAGSAAFSPPTKVEISQGESGNKIILRWKRVEGAVAYQIFRSADPKGPFNIKIAELPYLEYEDLTGDDGKDMKEGDVYYYKLASVNADGDPSGDKFPVGEKEGLKGSTFGGSVYLSTEAGMYPDKIVLNWQHLPSVRKYSIYRSENKNIQGDIIAEITPESGAKKISYVDPAVKASVIYFYTLMLQGSADLIIQQTETVKSYLKSASAPAKPANFSVSQGSYTGYIKLEWDPVPGATGYEVSRSILAAGPYEDIASLKPTVLSYNDNPYGNSEVQSFSYYYKVVALNPAPGEYSDIIQGWANKAPVNITASSNYGGRVKLNWDPVPGAFKYKIVVSGSKNGPYAPSGEAPANNGISRVEYSHTLNIFPERVSNLYYKVSVQTKGGESDPSDPVQGRIAKADAPEGLLIRNNHTATDKLLRLAWKPVPGALKYRVYRATLMHRYASVSGLKTSDYRAIKDVDSNAYEDSLTSFPLRRYDYQIVALDGDGAEGSPSYTGEAYRLPNDLVEFAKDADFGVIEAQTRIASFGDMSSGGQPKGRGGGYYDFYAGMSGSKSLWRNFCSFEAILNSDGDHSITVTISPMGAYQNGSVTVTGLYSGKITYNNLLGSPGGYSTGGSITATYHHPTEGVLQTNFSLSEAGAQLWSVILPSEAKNPYPSYETGGGGIPQPGWSRP